VVVIDLGCFNNKKAGSVGVDKFGPPRTQADVVCNVGFEPLPFPDNYADEVYATNLLEHIAFRSPEHVSYWTYETIEMFCDGYYGTRGLWGHTSNFKMVERFHNGESMAVSLEAIK